MNPADPVHDMLLKLWLHHTAKNYSALLDAAAKDNLSHAAFLERLLRAELDQRHQNTVARLIKEAHFPAIKTIDTFDWAHPSSIPKAIILQAFRLDFIEKKQHLIFLGSGGLGKSHLATAIGVAACQREFKTLFTTAADMINRLVASQADHGLERALRKFTSPRLLILDELGYLPLDKQGRDLLFQVISKRAETGSIILTTNRPFKEWTEVFQDHAVATAIADRLIEYGELIKIEGPSYRLKRRKLKNFRSNSSDRKE